MNRIAFILFVAAWYGTCIAQSGIAYIPEVTSIDFNAPLNTNVHVGYTSGAYSVDHNGAFNYTIPLFTPTGTNGLQPDLSIQYNNNIGNGMLGSGWQINGLSRIERVHRNHHFDGKSRSIQMDSTDAIALDGQRLVKDGSNYIKELDDLTQIYLNGTLSDSTAWFKVVTKNGFIYEYGNETPSNPISTLKTNDHDNISIWFLNKVSDVNGNYMEYVYKWSNAAGQVYLDEIRYTGNSLKPLLPYNSIKFTYSLKTDKNISYSGGSFRKSGLLLDAVELFAEGAFVKKYRLQYSLKSGYSLLTKITEIATNGASYNPTLIQYGSSNDSVSRFSISNISNGNPNRFVTGDYNGDGLSDIMRINQAYTGIGSLYYDTGFNLFTHSKDANDHQFSNTATASGWTQTFVVQDNTLNTLIRTYMTTDYNGDAKDDLLKFDKILTSGTYELHDFSVYSFDDAGSLVSHNKVYNFTGNWNRLPASSQFFIPGDFDGDGVQDFLTILSDGIHGFKLFFNSAFKKIYSKEVNVSLPPGSTLYGILTSDFFYPFDMNGDGKMELMAIKNLKTRIFELDHSNSSIEAALLYEDYYPNKYHDVQFGDFNGDGNTDLLTCSRSTGNTLNPWEVAYSTGINFDKYNTGISYIQHFNPHSNLPQPSQRRWDDHESLKIGDFNRDGKSDVIYMDHGVNNSSSNFEFHIYESIGNRNANGVHGFEKKLLSYPKNSSYFTATDIADFNGDGFTDVLNRANIFSDIELFQFKDSHEGRMLKKVQNGMKAEIEVGLSPLNDSAAHYEDSMINIVGTYPFTKISHPVYVTSNVSESNGIGGSKKKSWFYKNAILNREGKGLLGFEQLEMIDHTKDEQETVLNDLDTNYAYFTESKTVKSDSSIRISEKTYQYDVLPQFGKAFRLNLRSIKEENLLSSVMTMTTFNYDSYQNIIKRVKEVVGQTKETEENTYTSTIYNYPTDVHTITLTRERSLNGTGMNFQSNTTFSYDSLGQVLERRDFSGLPESIITRLQYDVYGNIIERNTSTPSINPITNKWDYDVRGRFIINETNNLNQINSYSYNKKWSKPDSIKYAGNHSSKYFYDEFGELIEEMNARGVSTFSGLDWALGGNSVYKHFTQRPGNGKIEEHFDQLGRLIKSKSDGFNGAIYSEKEYDDVGNLIRETDPHYGSATVLYETIYLYDHLDRVEKIEQKANSIPISSSLINRSYNPHYTETTINSDGTLKSIIKDELGAVIEANDNGGVLTYRYHPTGTIARVDLDGINQLEQSIDQYGRIVSLTDKDAGNTEYEYNGLGSLVYQRSSKGDETFVNLDAMQRPESIFMSDDTVLYNYHTTGPSLNKVKNVKLANGNHSQEFYYNNYGQTIEKKDRIKGINYSTIYTYDSIGFLKSKIFASGLEIKYNWDANGYLKMLSDHLGSALHENIELDAYDRALKYVNGNGAHTEIVYSNENKLKAKKVGSSFSTPSILNIEYDFDPHSNNLSNKTDLLGGNIESWQFDNQNRLLGSDLNSSPFMNTMYDLNGNISFKSNVGTYQYHTNKEGAIERSHNNSSLIRNLRQDIAYQSYDQPLLIEEGPLVCQPLELYQEPNYPNSNQSNTGGAGHENETTICKRLHEYSFTNGINANRVEMYYHYNALFEFRRHYLDNLEINYRVGSDPEFVHYISGGDGINIIAVRQDVSGMPHDTIYYAHTDYLGSIIKVSDPNLGIVAELNYDSWGRARNPLTLTYNTGPGMVKPSWLSRGYGGHEHLDSVYLVNMNGRLYDQTVSRMLSPDNVIQDPFHSQSYNRYSYALNNPLRFTDPDGEIAWVPIAIMAAFSAATNVALNAEHIDNFWEGAGYFAIGAASSIVGGIGGSFAASAGSLALGALIGGASSIGSALLSQAGNSVLSGEKMRAKPVIISGALGVVSGAISGGLNSAAKEAENAIGLTYEYNVDLNTGNINKVSDLGGSNLHFFNRGYYVDNGSAFKLVMDQFVANNNLVAIRFWQDAATTLSGFVVPASGLTGYFLEPGGPSTKVANQNKRIPAGSYKLTPNYNRYKGSYMLFNKGVSANRGITIHAGNTAADTRGCLLPGCNWNGASVSHSKAKLSELNFQINKVGYHNFNITIADGF